MTRWALLLLALAGCESSFDPIAPSDLRFTMSGYLDASADTQFVRVEPITRTEARTDEEIPAVVTLTGPAGEVTLQQRVRSFLSGPAHLFWTTARIEPGATYRLRAEAPDGAAAVATVAIPDTAGVTVHVSGADGGCPVLVNVTGAERLAEVASIYVLQVGARRRREVRSYVEFIKERADGSLQTSIYPGSDIRAIRLGPAEHVVTSEVRVALATSDWPDLAGVFVEDALQSGVDRVEGGLGFVGGVVTQRTAFRLPPGCGGPSPE